MQMDLNVIHADTVGKISTELLILIRLRLAGSLVPEARNASEEIAENTVLKARHELSADFPELLPGDMPIGTVARSAKQAVMVLRSIFSFLTLDSINQKLLCEALRESRAVCCSNNTVYTQPDLGWSESLEAVKWTNCLSENDRFSLREELQLMREGNKPIDQHLQNAHRVRIEVLEEVQLGVDAEICQKLRAVVQTHLSHSILICGSAAIAYLAHLDRHVAHWRKPVSFIAGRQWADAKRLYLQRAELLRFVDAEMKLRQSLPEDVPESMRALFEKLEAA